MKKVFLIFVFAITIMSLSLPQTAQATERGIVQVGKNEIITNGLYFKISDVAFYKHTITVTAKAKNKSMLSQAIYFELSDESNNIYTPENPPSQIKIFNPLKFNTVVSETLSFTVPDCNKKYWLNLYSRDIFKKNKKELITKFSLKDTKQ